MEKIYHYTSFETLQKIIETGTIRLNSLLNVDDAEEGVLLDTQSQAAYTFVSCWTKKKEESIPLWSMYVKSPFAVRIAVTPDFLKPAFFKRYFISNHTDRNSYVYLFHRGRRGNEFLSDVVYQDLPRLSMCRNTLGFIDEDYIKNYGIIKNSNWMFQEEIRFVVKAVPLSQLKPFKKSSLYITCEEVILNNDRTSIKNIDMRYESDVMLSADIMLGPSTTSVDENLLRNYLKEKLPGFVGGISRSTSFIRSQHQIG